MPCPRSNFATPGDMMERMDLGIRGRKALLSGASP
jgi:hypothetical protein